MSTAAFQSVTWKEVMPHLKFGLLITGSFVVAWSWDLVIYGISHAAADENPLQNQISFGDARAPKYAIILLMQYLVVCAAAAALSHFVKALEQPWSPAAVMAVEFLPSPFFAGKLMAWLGQFSRLDAVQQGVLNLGATWVAAALAHALPDDFGTRIDARLGRWTPIVQNTLGFGLGIAWNVFLGQLLGPEKRGSNGGDIGIVHLIGLLGYFAVVLLWALHLAAHQKDDSSPTLWDRQLDLLSFAMQVVCAFTLVAVLDALTHPAWYGAIEAMVILLALSAVLNALVAGVDMEALRQRVANRNGNEDSFQMPKGPTLVLFFIPCVWCCCPWVPLLVLLAGTARGAVQEEWFQLVAMVTGLAASIEGSNCLLGLMDAAAGGFCNAKHCNAPWIFVVWQIAVAVGTTVVLIPCLAPLCTEQADGSSTADDNDTATRVAPNANAASRPANEKQRLLV